jgi:ligand-binding SRPBCC domain-containing protein
MAHVRHSYRIEAPPEVAWRVGSDPDRMAEWNTTVIGVKDVTGPLDQPGTRYTTISKIAGRQTDVTWTIERVEPDRMVEATATTPLGGDARLIVDYEPDGRGTRLTTDLEFEIAPGLLGGMIDKLYAERAVEREVRHSSDNFKAMVEAEVGAVGRSPGEREFGGANDVLVNAADLADGGGRA